MTAEDETVCQELERDLIVIAPGLAHAIAEDPELSLWGR
jgi:hypothetical protein